MPFTMKYLDGTPAEPEYVEQVGKLISEVADIETHIHIDDLEDFARQQAQKQ